MTTIKIAMIKAPLLIMAVVVLTHVHVMVDLCPFVHGWSHSSAQKVSHNGRVASFGQQTTMNTNFTVFLSIKQDWL